MIALHVNIDHVATLRQARRGVEPEPVTAAGIAEMSGADGITIISERIEGTSKTVTSNSSGRLFKLVLTWKWLQLLKCFESLKKFSLIL